MKKEEVCYHYISKILIGVWKFIKTLFVRGERCSWTAEKEMGSLFIVDQYGTGLL